MKTKLRWPRAAFGGKVADTRQHQDNVYRNQAVKRLQSLLKSSSFPAALMYFVDDST